jgi:hypothetical protein
MVGELMWICGLANTGEAVRRLAAFRASLPDRRSPAAERPQ